ncbi:hypothetical protein [Candidatus Palauibacter sp.]|uniref:hypothetical protein n=1 Tax=Candidatus Palauibacter sp. TaxID=3101350 RepID=UPI003B52CB5D
MLHRILAPALLVPVLTLANAVPASAQFDFGSWFQRATIIANQITQISHQVSQIRSMARQLTELQDQLDHMERAARGEIDALLQPFSDLAADPVGLVRDGLGWRSDFTGQARRTVDAVRAMGSGRSVTELWRTAHGTADRVNEADILGLFRNLPPQAATRALEDYRRAREAADRRRVLDYAALDAAAALAGTIESAQGSFADLTSNRNISNTALQQARVAAALSQGRINAAAGQVLAHQAAAEASRARQAELARLEWLGRWHDDHARANALAETMRDAALLNRSALRDGLLFRIPSFYR